MLAEEFHLPVVPLTIDGAFDVLPRFKRFPMPGTITLTIHPAINPPADGSHYNLPELMARCKSTIESALPPPGNNPTTDYNTGQAWRNREPQQFPHSETYLHYTKKGVPPLDTEAHLDVYKPYSGRAGEGQLISISSTKMKA